MLQRGRPGVKRDRWVLIGLCAPCIVSGMGMFVGMMMQDPFTYFAWVGIVAFSVCFHEYSHARMALRMGDDTAALLGHLSMNPAVQMGPMSLAMLFLFGIAWGAVPVNPGRFRTQGQAAAVAFAGPAANLLLCLVCAAAAAALALRPGVGGPDYIGRFFSLAAIANGVLFFFNMLPVPVFDGWAVGAMFFPAMRNIHPQRAGSISAIVMAVLFLTPLGSVVWAIGSAIGEAAIAGWLRLLAVFV